MPETSARKPIVSIRASDAERQFLEGLAAHLTLKRGKKQTTTDVIKEGVRLLAETEKFKGASIPKK